MPKYLRMIQGVLDITEYLFRKKSIVNILTPCSLEIPKRVNGKQSRPDQTQQ